MTGYEFGMVTWSISRDKGTVNLAGTAERLCRGGVSDIVEVLTGLGHEGWDVAACTTGRDYLIWTMRRQL
ncbi:hypothetical protein [Kibdelosporangium phytohabitans]|uniref:DUF4177 domain-containing protein n=1 Tax=Kibdelosporangium phytohabitans TaxID=860235 RepID=A0A0N9HT41_9PSEU|nr:hypothetical protein [Kibdelosporangium phytohabitans]ALG10405.1 hypothetical protein AOZ06_29070 [Kibdelosporangium phytohabitans]MBE1461467.1 hypothetical protein [Kibdelosporangium phytohabitans]